MYTSFRTPTHSLHKILQPYVAATVRVSSNEVLSSIGSPLIKTVTKTNKLLTTNDGSLQTDFALDLVPCYT